MTIRLEGISKRFGGVAVVSDLDLKIADGEFFTLLGGSGSGKTTILRMIAGFERPDSGRILIDGRAVSDPEAGIFVPPERRGLGMVFQSYALWPHLSVRGNLALGLEERGMARTAIAERVGAALALVGLDGLEMRHPHELSGGQQQRVALARALAMESKVLLLDEPLSNLDAALRETVRDEIRALQRKLGLIALLVTHDQVEAMSVSDRIAILHGGKIAEIDTPETLYHRPRTQFVATFLGRANLLRGHATNGRVRVGTADLRTEASLADGDVTLMIRPEWIAFADGADSFPGYILQSVLLGGITRYAVEVPALGCAVWVDRPSVGAALRGAVRVQFLPEYMVPLAA